MSEDVKQITPKTIKDLLLNGQRKEEFVEQLIERTRSGEIIWTYAGSFVMAEGDGYSADDTSFFATFNGMRITCVEHHSWLSSFGGSSSSYELEIEKDQAGAVLEDREGWFAPKPIKKLYKLLRKQQGKNCC